MFGLRYVAWAVGMCVHIKVPGDGNQSLAPPSHFNKVSTSSFLQALKE
jgi:hypothetical protein